VSDARPYKLWAGVRHRMVTQDLACNHTMEKSSRLNVEYNSTEKDNKFIKNHYYVTTHCI
jgi:hypothetical protein